MDVHVIRVKTIQEVNAARNSICPMPSWPRFFFWNGPATKLVRSESLWIKAGSVRNMLWLRLFFSVYRELIPVMFRDSDLYILLANRAGAE
jgi:hypothetical protein